MIRACSIVLVLILHASNEYYTTIQASALESSFYWWTSTVYKSLTLPCVPLFVILSGALLLQESKLNESIRFFFRKRFNRLGLAFVFWTLVYLAWGFFVTQTPVTGYNVLQGGVFSFLTGSYYHFWFLYLIVGLYLITPMLRAVVAHDDHEKILKYTITLWFIGVSVVPLIQLVTGYSLNNTLFVMGGSVGYFMLGVYLQKISVKSWILYAVMIVSFGCTILGTWLMNFPLYSIGQEYFFFDYLSANVIASSVALFMLLCKIPVDWAEKCPPKLCRVIHAISLNTLPIYLFHLIIMETLQRGYLGFKLSITVINPVIGIPIITFVTLFITLGLVLAMKKVPVLRTVIG